MDKIGFCYVVLEIAISVSSTGYIIIITLNHVKKLKNIAESSGETSGFMM